MKIFHLLCSRQRQSHMRRSVSQSVGAHDKIFFTVWQLRSAFLWGALSDERTGLSGPWQRRFSRVRVPLDSRPYFTVSDLRLPFPSPPTTRRVTVEVFDPASIVVTFRRISRNCNCCACCLQDNSSASITKKTHPLYFCLVVFIAPLHSEPHRKHRSSIVTCV
jgi:hypothetical protein